MNSIQVDILRTEIESYFISIRGFAMDLFQSIHLSIEKSSLVDSIEIVEAQDQAEELVSFHQHQLDLRFQFHLYSVILITYSNLEFALELLVKSLKTNYPETEVIKKLANTSTIERHLKTIKKFRSGSLVYDELDIDWRKIMLFHRLRKLIAHHNGSKENVSNGTWNNLKTCLLLDGIKLGENGYVHIQNTDTLVDYIETVERLLLKVTDNLKRQITEN